MTNTRKELSTLIQLGLIPSDKIEQALSLTIVRPDNHSWKTFVSNLLLWIGVIALTSSVMFFIAYNWDDLGRFAKFGFVEVLIVLCIAVYWKTYKPTPSISPTTVKSEITTKPKNIISQAALLMASLLLGVLLAFYGQTYQTGADPWQLFYMWALLITPWVLVARFPSLWIIWLALFNLAAFLYVDIYRGFFGFLFYSNTSLMWLMLCINTPALILWEVFSSRLKWLNESWATRLITLAAGVPLTFLLVNSIFSSRTSTLPPAVLWLAAMAAIYYFYRKIKPDLFMLSMACLSGIVVLTSGASMFIFDVINFDDLGGILLMAIVVIGLGGTSAAWLKKIHKEQQS